MLKIIKNLFSFFRNNRGEKQKILVIESRYKTLQFLDRALGNRYSLLITQDKNDCLNKIKSEKVDLIILNSKLNKERTLDLCFAIRNAQQTSNVPLVIIAKKDDDSQVAEFYAQKIQGYLIEPFTKQDILAQVQLALNSNRGE